MDAETRVFPVNQSSARQERRTLRTLALIKSVHLVTFALAMPLGPQLSRVLGLGPLQHGLFAAAYPLAAGLCGFAVLFFTDRFAGRRSLLAASCAFALSLFACAAAEDFNGLLASRLLCGAFGGLLCAWLPLSVTRATATACHRPALRRSLAWKPAVAIALGLPLVIYIATVAGWRAGFASLGVVMAFSIPFVLLLPPLNHPAFERHASERQLRVLIHQRRNRIALAVGALLAASSALMVTFFSGIMVLNAGFAERDLAVFFVVGGTVAVLLIPVIERWSAGRSPFGVLIASAVAAVLAYAALASFGNVGWGVALPVVILFMLTNAARFAPASVLINLHLKPRYLARYLGLSAVTQQAAAALGILTAGVCITHPPGEPLHGVGLVATLATLLLGAAVLLAAGLQRHPRDLRGAVPLVRETPAD